MKSICSIVGIYVLLSLFSCNPENGHQVDLLEPYQALLKEVKFIGHKGAGDPPAFGYRNHVSNSFASLQYAIKNTSGTEMDLQISADSTIWLFHDHQIKLCDSVDWNMALLTDQQIRAASKCNYSNELITMRELVEKLRPLGFTNKVISLDLKVLQNKEALNHFGNEDGLAKLIVSLLSELNNLKGFKILAEVPKRSYIHYFKEDSLIEVFLLTRKMEDFDETDAAGYSADINLFNSNKIEIDENKKLQLWVANTIEDLLKAVQLKADYVQSDNVALEMFLERSKTAKLHAKEVVSKSKDSKLKQGDEYLDVKHFSLESLNSSLVFQYQFESAKGIDSTSLLVYSCKDKNGKYLFWTGRKIDPQKTSYLQFIDAEKLIRQGGIKLKVFIWNQSKSELEIIHPSLLQWDFEAASLKN